MSNRWNKFIKNAIRSFKREERVAKQLSFFFSFLKVLMYFYAHQITNDMKNCYFIIHTLAIILSSSVMAQDAVKPVLIV